MDRDARPVLTNAGPMPTTSLPSPRFACHAVIVPIERGQISGFAPLHRGQVAAAYPEACDTIGVEIKNVCDTGSASHEGGDGKGRIKFRWSNRGGLRCLLSGSVLCRRCPRTIRKPMTSPQGQNASFIMESLYRRPVPAFRARLTLFVRFATFALLVARRLRAKSARINYTD